MKQAGFIITIVIWGMLLSPVNAQRKAEKVQNSALRTENFESRNFHSSRKMRSKAEKKLRKRHLRKLKRMAAVDGRISPKERRMLRRERKRVY